MKKLLFSLALLCMFLYSVTIVVAAPSMQGIALNQETEQCARYWSGDEFRRYTLPEGWVSYYPNYDSELEIFFITTPIGECDFSDGIENCCNQLGYYFVEGNIGRGSYTSFGFSNLIGSFVGSLLFPIIIVVFAVLVFLKVKTKAFFPFINSYPRKGFFAGFLFAFFTFLSALSIFHFSGVMYQNPVSLFFMYVSIPAIFVTGSFFDDFSLFAAFFLLIVNTIIFGLFGAGIGLIVKKLKK